MSTVAAGRRAGMAPAGPDRPCRGSAPRRRPPPARVAARHSRAPWRAGWRPGCGPRCGARPGAAATAHRTRECISSGAQASSTERLLTGAEAERTCPDRASCTAALSPCSISMPRPLSLHCCPTPFSTGTMRLSHVHTTPRRSRVSVMMAVQPPCPGTAPRGQAPGRLRAAGHRYDAPAPGPGLRLDVGSRPGVGTGSPEPARPRRTRCRGPHGPPRRAGCRR